MSQNHQEEIVIEELAVANLKENPYPNRTLKAGKAFWVCMQVNMPQALNL